jgi:hypothetical protein
LRVKVDKHVRDQAPDRQQQDVHLGMAKEPEQMLEEDRVAAASGIEETGAEVAIGEQHGHRAGQHRNGGDQQEGGDQPAPGKKWQLHHRHPRCAQVENGHDDVDRAQDRRDAKNVNREDGEVDAHATLHRQWRVERPAGVDRAIADTEQRQDEGQRQQRRRRWQEPETPVVDARQSHVRRPDHQRNLPVGKACRSRHQRGKYHDQSMYADQLIEELGLHQLQTGLEQLGPDGKNHRAADEEHDQRESHVHRADVLVIRGCQPAHDATLIGFGVLTVAGVVLDRRCSAHGNLLIPGR